VVPLRGDLIEVVTDLLHRLQVEFEETLAAGSCAADDFRTLKDAKVLGDGLTSEMRTGCELGD
jgi:hypothetical protein